VYFLLNKLADTTLQALKHYHKLLEKQTGKQSKRIRMDEGPEFDNRLWREYLAEHGIIHEMTSPYSSSGNAVTERANRTVMDCVRTILHDAGLPGTYWAEGAATIVYLKDFVPMARHPGKTPHELWYGKKPDIAHLRPFGCTAYVRVPEEVIGGKLNDQSIKCVLLGYFGHDGYQLLDRSSRRIFHSCDIIFEEGVTHRTLDTGSLSAGEQLSDDEGYVTLSEPELPNTPSIQDDERAQGLAPAHLTAPTIPVTPVITPLTAVEPPVPHHSTWNMVPTCAINESRESEQHIGQARRDGEEWAKMVTINAFLTHLDDTVALLIDPENNWIPNSYTEGMTRLDLWKEPMDKEIANMHAHQVWTLVDRPSDIKPMQNRWTFANKYDISGKLVGRKARLVAKVSLRSPGWITSRPMHRLSGMSRYG
jgi:hypothetical protein